MIEFASETKPFFIITAIFIGFLVMSNFGTFFKIWWSSREKDEENLHKKIEALSQLLHQNMSSVIKLESRIETLLPFMMDVPEMKKDIGFLHQKIRDINGAQRKNRK